MSPSLLIGFAVGYALAPLWLWLLGKILLFLRRLNPWRCPYVSGSRCLKWDKHWVGGDPNHSWDYWS